MSLATVLQIDQLSKRFGSVHAVRELSFNVPAGSVYGILGPNGSGKTTTLGILLQVIHPDSGNFSWFGEQPTHHDRKKIGAILETPVFYPYLSALKNLQIIASIKGIPEGSIDEVLTMVELIDRKNDPFKNYSLGMKQRLAIAGALLGDPKVLILDEPTNGLDPQGIAWTRELIKKVASKGTTIILASHLLDEVEKVCTHVAVLQNGSKVYDGRVDDMLREGKSIRVAAKDMNALQKALEDYPEAGSISRDGDFWLVSGTDHLNCTDLNHYLFQREIVVSHLSTMKNNLEKQFLALLQS